MSDNKMPHDKRLQRLRELTGADVNNLDISLYEPISEPRMLRLGHGNWYFRASELRMIADLLEKP